MQHTVETLGLDRTELFPSWAADIEAGRPLICHGGMIEAAQDRVAMRRYIRRHYPTLSATVRDMGEAELSELVENIRSIHGGA